MEKAKIAFRWIAVLPAWILGGIAANLVFALGSCYFDPYLSADVVSDDGFGGHIIMAPVLLMLRSAACGAAAMVAVAWVAPRGKRETSFVVAAVVATFSGIALVLQTIMWNANHVSMEAWLRSAVDIVPGAIAGFVVASGVPHGATDEDLKRAM